MSKQQCPEFPFFGARYPDATCIDCYLWDLDSCEEPGGGLCVGGDSPCPFCNAEEFIKVRLDEGWTRQEIESWLKEFYAKHEYKPEEKEGEA